MASLRNNRFARKSAEREDGLTHQEPEADTGILAIDVRGKVTYDGARARSVEVYGQRLVFEESGFVVLNNTRYQLVVDGEREELQRLA